MVLQHHEYGDGSGYPEGLKLAAIHPWARVLRILDSYEALTARRRWRQEHNPSQALWIMRQEWENSVVFDPHYLARFIKFLATP
jgi:HD-GYP domain-containing protein (c-di-GMP phosphodiesterase class II)